VHSDEEKGLSTLPADRPSAETQEERKSMDDAPQAQPRMRDVFSWQNVEYTVTLPSGEQRRLLDGVSGFVVPGKLTALMGESGAGKVSTVLIQLRVCMDS
jgi:ATP-binding cassette subfamily G (WHITE) protein 2 (SNQ2)